MSSQFLRESLRDDVSMALRRRSGLSAVRTMGCAGPIEIEIQVRLRRADRTTERREQTCVTYQVAIDQYGDRPYVAFERCSYTDDGVRHSIEARVAFEVQPAMSQETVPDDDSVRGRTRSIGSLARSAGARSTVLRRCFGHNEAHVVARGGCSVEGPSTLMFRGHPDRTRDAGSISLTSSSSCVRFLFDAHTFPTSRWRVAKRPSDVSGDRWLSEDGDNLAEVIRRLKDED